MHICLITSGRPFEAFPGGEGRFTASLRECLIKKDVHPLNVTVVGRKLFGVQVLRSDEVPGIEPSTKSARPRTVPLPYPIFSMSMLVTSLLFTLSVLAVNQRSRISIIHAQDTGYSGLSAIIAAKILQIPAVLSSHGVRHVTLYRALRGVSKLISWPFELSLDVATSRTSDSIIVVASSQKNVFTRLGVEKGKITMIPIGIDTGDFKIPRSVRQAVREELGVSDDTVIGFVGRFFPEKNLFTLLSSFAQALNHINRMKLVLVGTGPLEDQLRALCHELNITDKVVFTGFREDVNRVLSAMDVFALPSYAEGCPTALLEAMASGRAIISSSIPSIEGIVKHDKEAILVDPYDAEELKQAILLLHKNPDLRTELGHNAEKRAEAYSISEICERILRLYEELIRNSRAR